MSVGRKKKKIFQIMVQAPPVTAGAGKLVGHERYIDRMNS
jgi:hypothetical protein